MMSSYFAAGATIDMSGSTTYQIDEDNVDMSGLPFTPVFDASHVYAGQSVMPISSGGMMSGSGGMMGGGSMGGTMTASNLELEPQGLSGTVATSIGSGTATSFMLTLPSDSAFTTMTGATSVTYTSKLGPRFPAARPSPAAPRSMHSDCCSSTAGNGRWSHPESAQCNGCKGRRNRSACPQSLQGSKKTPNTT